MVSGVIHVLVAFPVEFEYLAVRSEQVLVALEQVGVLHEGLDHLRDEAGVLVVEQVEPDAHVLSDYRKIPRSQVCVVLLNGIAVLVRRQQLGHEPLSGSFEGLVVLLEQVLLCFFEVSGWSDESVLDFVFFSDDPSLQELNSVVVEVYFLQECFIAFHVILKVLLINDILVPLHTYHLLHILQVLLSELCGASEGYLLELV